MSTANCKRGSYWTNRCPESISKGSYNDKDGSQ